MCRPKGFRRDFATPGGIVMSRLVQAKRQQPSQNEDAADTDKYWRDTQGIHEQADER